MIANNLKGFEALPQTIPHYCIESFRRHNKRDALAFKIDDVWNYLNGNEVIERVKRIAFGLAAMGVKPGDRVAIISENRPEWSFVDLAILSQALHHARHPQRAVDEACRILRPGGQLLVLDLNEHTFEKARELYADVWLGFTECTLHGFLKKAGFIKVEVTAVAKEAVEPHFETLLASGVKGAR